MKSRICNELSHFRLENKYYQRDIIKAKFDLDNNIVKYAYSPKKEELIVVMNNALVRIFLLNGTLRSECSCNKYYECEHVLPAFIYAMKHYQIYDDLCATGDDVRTIINLSTYEIYEYLKRMIGPEHILLSQYISDFVSNLNKLMLKLKKDTSINSSYIHLLTINLLQTITDSKGKKIDFMNECFELLDTIKDLNNEKVYLGIDEYISKGNNFSNISITIDEYSQTLFSNDSILKDMITYIVNNIERFKTLNKDFSIDDIELIILVKAIYLKNNQTNKLNNEFKDFCLKFILITKIKILLYKELIKENDYESIVSLWDEEKDKNNPELIEIYLYAMVKLNKINNTYYLEMFLENPNMVTFETIMKSNLINDEDLDKIKAITFEKASYIDKINIFMALNDNEKLFEICKDRGIDEVRKYFMSIYKGIGNDLIIYYQNEIEKSINKNINNDEYVKYLNDMRQIDLGDYYVYHFVRYLIEKEDCNYYTSNRLRRYLLSLSL